MANITASNAIDRDTVRSRLRAPSAARDCGRQAQEQVRSRGFMEMRLRGVRNDDGAFMHEIVHVYAPNDNRFLADGLAVCLHQELAGNRAFPKERGLRKYHHA
jgi:hypothetical protein